MCVFIFVVFGFILISFRGYCLIIWDGLEPYFCGVWLHFFWVLGNLEGIRASSARCGVPLGARVSPRRVQWAKSWFVGPPLGSQFRFIFTSCLQFVSIENASTKKKWVFDPFWVHFGSLLGCFWSLFVYFGHVFQSSFVCMKLCGHRVFKVVSHVMLLGIPLCFSALQSNSPTRKKTDRAEKRPSSSSRDGFLRIHDATTFIVIRSVTPGSHRISSHSGTAVPIYTFWHPLWFEMKSFSMALLYLSPLSVGSLNCMVWHCFHSTWHETALCNVMWFRTILYCYC